MPIERKTDTKGSYYQWGSRGKKYYYKPGSGMSRNRAYNNALKQAIAAYANGFREK